MVGLTIKGEVVLNIHSRVWLMNDHSILASGIYGQVRFKLLFFLSWYGPVRGKCGPRTDGVWSVDFFRGKISESFKIET